MNMFSTYMVLRKQRHFELYNIIQSGIRLLMLGNLLNIPGFSWMDDMVISVFGIIQNFIGVSKAVSLIKEQHARLHMHKHKHNNDCQMSVTSKVEGQSS